MPRSSMPPSPGELEAAATAILNDPVAGFADRVQAQPGQAQQMSVRLPEPCCWSFSRAAFDNWRTQDMQTDAHEIETDHPTPLKAVRRHCLSCCGDSANEVRLCPVKACPLWPFRHGHRPNAEDRAPVADRQLYPLERDLTGGAFQGSALRAIRLRCIDCSGNSDVEVRACKFGTGHQTPCDLHPFRLGRNPNISRSLKWKQAAAERLAVARAAALPTKPSQNPNPLRDHGAEGVGAGEGRLSPEWHVE
jgi:hypothetical protein